MAAAAGEPSAKKSKTQEPAAKTGTHLIFLFSRHRSPLCLTLDTAQSLTLFHPHFFFFLPVPVPVVTVPAPVSVVADLTGDAMQVEAAVLEDIAIDDLVPSSTPIPAAEVAVTPVPTPVSIPATATVRFGAVQEIAPSGFPTATGTNRGVAGLFPPSGNKSPFGSSFGTMGAGAGAGAAVTPAATSGLSFLGAATSTSTSTATPTPSNPPFLFGSGAKKGSSFASQHTMGFSGLGATSASPAAEVVPPPATAESEAMVIHSEESTGYVNRDMTEGEGVGEVEDDFDGAHSYFEDEHSRSSTFTQPMGSTFTPAPLSVPPSSSFGFSNPSSEAQKPSIFGSKRPLGETSFGSSVSAGSAGSSFGAAAPFFLLGQSSASPRIGIAPAVTGAINPFAVTPAAALPTPDAAPAVSAAPTPFSSSVPTDSHAAAVPIESRQAGMPLAHSLSAVTPVDPPTPAPTPTPIQIASTLSTPAPTQIAASLTPTPVPIAASLSNPTPAPARQAQGRKLKPKPAHLVAAIPAYAPVTCIL